MRGPVRVLDRRGMEGLAAPAETGWGGGGRPALICSLYLTCSPHPTQEATWEVMQHNSLLEEDPGCLRRGVGVHGGSWR